MDEIFCGFEQAHSARLIRNGRHNFWFHCTVGCEISRKCRFGRASTLAGAIFWEVIEPLENLRHLYNLSPEPFSDIWAALVGAALPAECPCAQACEYHYPGLENP